MSNNEFALEQLEGRLETLCYYYWYVGICYKSVWGIRIPYFCWKLRIYCY